MSKHHQMIVTSEIDKNYFIITNGNFYISELIQLLEKRNMDVTAMLNQVTNNPNLINKKIFIAKDSDLGIELTKLINEQELVDEARMIRESYLYDALISAVINDEEQLYVEFIANLIKEKRVGTIDSLKNLHIEKLLERVSYDGRKNNYVKEKIITGFETKGIIYQDGMWVPADLTPKRFTKVRR